MNCFLRFGVNCIVNLINPVIAFTRFEKLLDVDFQNVTFYSNI